MSKPVHGDEIIKLVKTGRFSVVHGDEKKAPAKRKTTAAKKTPSWLLDDVATPEHAPQKLSD